MNVSAIRSIDVEFFIFSLPLKLVISMIAVMALNLKPNLMPKN